MSEDGISETVSEKRPRGRPKVLTEEFERELSRFGFFTEQHSRRGQLNVYYRQRAMSILSRHHDAAFVWLWDQKRLLSGVSAPKLWRPTILTELGRIDDTDDLCRIARDICQEKPMTTDAVRMIRHWRITQRDRRIIEYCKSLGV